MSKNILGLYPHNQISYQHIQHAYASGENVVGIIHATGTGKTYNALQLAYDNPNKKILYVTPYNSIIEHVKGIINNNPNIDINKDFQHVEFVTYAALSNMSSQELTNLNVDLLILDEFHHIGAPVWGDAIQTIINTHEALKIFGMSAYSVRDRGTKYERDMAEPNGNELFSDKIVSYYDLVDAILDGVLPVPTYKTAYLNILKYINTLENKVSQNNHPNTTEYLKILRNIKSQIISNLDTKEQLLSNIKHNGKYIYFCPPMSVDKTNDIHTIMAEMHDYLLSQGYTKDDFEFYYTIGEEENLGRKNRQAFYNDQDLNGKSTSHKLRIMFAINQYNEGVHAPNVDGVILGRGTKSDIVYYEQIGRALSIRGNTYKQIELLKTLSPEALEALSIKRGINTSGLTKDDVIERLVAPTIIDLTGNITFIKDLIDDLKHRIKTRKRSITNTSRLINITNNSFDIDLLGQDIINILDNINNQYLPNTWEESYTLVQKYYSHYGNLNIPRSFKTEDGISYNEYGYPLGEWLTIQKKSYNKGQLSQEQITKLEKLKIVWKTTQSWEESFNLAKKYYETYGNLNINTNFKTIDGCTPNTNGYALGNWIVTQRRKYKLKQLSPVQIQKLESIGIIWSVLKSFEESYQLALEYFKKHGNINLPKDFCLEDGYNLGAFIYNQKQLRKEGKLSQERIQLLDKLGIDWSIKEVKQNPPWEEMFKLAQNYYLTYNNLDIKRTFITIDGITHNEDGYNLGRWISRQRSYYKKDKLSQEQIDKLESIGMEWSLEASYQSWEESYKLALDFFFQNNHLNIKTDYITESGYNLGAWIYLQRKNYTKELLSEEQIEKLNMIGMIWNVSSNYSRIKEILQEHCINYRKYMPLLKHLSVIEFESKINYLINNGYDIIMNNQLHEIFNMSNINMKVKYGVTREDLIREYLGIKKKV